MRGIDHKPLVLERDHTTNGTDHLTILRQTNFSFYRQTLFSSRWLPRFNTVVYNHTVQFSIKAFGKARGQRLRITYHRVRASMNEHVDKAS